LRLSDRLMRDAVAIVSEESALEVERWASGWLGWAWSAAGLGEREPQRLFHLEVVGRASSRPSPYGLAAVAGLRRVAAPGELPLLDGTLEILPESQSSPPWVEVPAFEPVRAWRAVDVWDSEHVLLVEYAGHAGDPRSDCDQSSRCRRIGAGAAEHWSTPRRCMPWRTWRRGGASMV
jgi:hypothetical protein